MKLCTEQLSRIIFEESLLRDLEDWEMFRGVREEFDKIPEAQKPDILSFLAEKYLHPGQGFYEDQCRKSRPLWIKIKEYFNPPVKQTPQAERWVYGKLYARLSSKLCEEIEKFPAEGRDAGGRMYYDRYTAHYRLKNGYFFIGLKEVYEEEYEGWVIKD